MIATNKTKSAFALNICIFVLEVFSIAWMMSGISPGLLSVSRSAALKFFTVDSNILMGIVSLIALMDQRKVLRGEKADMSIASYILKLAGTVGVTLTMVITVCFLLPTTISIYGPFALFSHSNFFLHLVNPILSIITFVCFEKTDRIALKHTFTGVVPALFYAVYYVAAAATHTQNGMIMEGYDWYGFFVAGINSVFVVLPILIVLTYALSFMLWKLNRRKAMTR